MHGSSPSFDAAWERFSVLILRSSARWIGPSFFWSWARTAPSSVGSVKVTTGSREHTMSFLRGGGLAAALCVAVSGGGRGCAAEGGGAVAPGFEEAGTDGAARSSQPACEAIKRLKEMARSAVR